MSRLEQSDHHVGGQIFLEVPPAAVVLLILCIVPAITADCIARERREGTLGLLFLTPLRSWEIVIGKVVVQALKASTFGWRWFRC